MNPTHKEALLLHQNGITSVPILPANQTGEKKPAIPWKNLTHQNTTETALNDWYNNREYGIGILTGTPSNDVIMVELEGTAAHHFATLTNTAKTQGLTQLWQTITSGWCETTPSGGYHWYMRVPGTTHRNTKLAKRPATPTELEQSPEKTKTLAETRGTGGYSVIAPTGPTFSHKNRAWTRLSGGPQTIATLTETEFNQILDLFRTLDETPQPEPEQAPLPAVAVSTPGRQRPGDQYNEQTPWEHILTGWQKHHQDSDGTIHWTRPGKPLSEGPSATTGHSTDGIDRLYVFSTSTEFPTEEPINKFRAYSILNHNGNDQAAARELARQGYGDQTKITIDLPATPTTPTTKENPTEENSEDIATPTWEPIDLTEILNGTYQPPTATLFTRTDGQSLLYPGLVHDIHGESESGKSLTIQTQCAHHLQNNQPVAYIDYESEPLAITERLQLMGATPQQIRNNFTYIRPEQDPYNSHELPSFQHLLNQNFTLIVIDGVTDALGQSGAASKDNDEIATWHRLIPRTLARHTGAAVVLIDHVTKNTDNRGRFAIGGQTKMAAIDGASYLCEIQEPLGRGLQGEITLRIAKDRPGVIRAKSGAYRASDRTQEAARITIDSTDPTRIITTINPPETNINDTAEGSVEPRGVMEKISRLVEAYQEPITRSALIKAYRADRGVGRQKVVLDAINRLVDGGYLIEKEGARGARTFRSARVYRDNGNVIMDLPVAEVVPFGGGHR